jgi:hypothetical protein
MALSHVSLATWVTLTPRPVTIQDGNLCQLHGAGHSTLAGILQPEKDRCIPHMSPQCIEDLCKTCLEKYSRTPIATGQPLKKNKEAAFEAVGQKKAACPKTPHWIHAIMHMVGLVSEAA